MVLTQTGQHERARRAFATVLERSPHAATTWNNLGLLELADRHVDQAARAFEQAVAADPRFAQAWEGLGASRVATDPSGAVEAWRRALELEPRNYDLLFNIAAVLHDHGQTSDARPYIERFVREAPRCTGTGARSPRSAPGSPNEKAPDGITHPAPYLPDLPDLPDLPLTYLTSSEIEPDAELQHAWVERRDDLVVDWRR